MSNSKRSSSGCFSSVLRRILCSGTLQAHPSDSDHIVDDVAKVQAQASGSGPGIVARLMGLDSLPANNDNWVHRGKIPGPVTRSRSVNFVDYMMQFDLTQAKHRRVKTASSFRELQQGRPALFQHDQNHEFLVVYFDENNEAAEFNKPRKTGKGDGSGSKPKPKDNVRENVACNKKQIRDKNKKISKLKNEPRGRGVSGEHSFKVGSCVNRANSKASKLENQKEVSVVTRKKKNQSRPLKKIEFDDNPFPILPVNRISKEPMELKSKKKCSSKSVKHGSPTTDLINARISKPERLGRQDFMKKNIESTDMEETEYYYYYYYMELVGKLSNLTEKDIKFSDWVTNKVYTFEDFEEICAEFGDQILDFMLHQVADELCRVSHANY